MTSGHAQNDREGLVRVAPRPAMAIEQPVLEWPLPIEQTTDYFTPTDKLFTLAHLGVPQIERDSWRLEVAGLVGQPMSLSYSDLQRFAAVTVRAFHQCAGNPLEPTKPGRTIANVEWRGVLLRDILRRAEISPACRHVWAYGQDFGTFFSFGPHQEHYVKDLPIDYVLNDDVLIATHLNGEPLPIKHGFPARVVAPGYYGTNSVKWLCRLELSERRANGFFTKDLYNDPAADGVGTRPVWRIEPESLVVAPANDSVVSGSRVTIGGWAWSPAEVVAVEVSTDGGQTWHDAAVERKQDACWQRFRYEWLPTQQGRYEVMSRASDSEGRTQPAGGARNAIHTIACTVA